MKFKLPSFVSQFLFATVFSAILSFNFVSPASADFNALVPCKESPAFQKRLASSVKKLENRLKLYTPESKEAKFLQNEIVSTQARFERYGNSSLLCGKEGLPRIIASGQWDHANEFVIPGILFLYITGWIGKRVTFWIRSKNTNPNCLVK